jgi:hypothetical protein
MLMSMHVTNVREKDVLDQMPKELGNAGDCLGEPGEEHRVGQLGLLRVKRGGRVLGLANDSNSYTKRI